MSWQTKFFDDFDNATVDVQTDPGGGVITEPAGTELTLYADGVSNLNWLTGSYDAPIAYEELTDHLNPLVGLLRMECRLSSLVRENYRVLVGMCLFKDRQNHYQFSWYDYDDDIRVQRWVNDAGATPYQAGDYGDPNTTAHIYRIYWNRLGRRVWVQDADRYLEPGELGFQFSTNDGASWVWALTEQPAFEGSTRFGVFFRHPTDSPEVTAGFDYLKLEVDESPNLIVGDQEAERENRTQPSALVETEDSPRDLGGDDYYVYGRGKELIGPSGYVETETDLRDLGGFRPSLVDPSRGVFLPSDPSSDAHVEVGVLADVIDADYLVEKPDADAKDLLYGGDVRAIDVARMDDGGFGLPVGNNHHGYAIDGKSYFGGVETSPGPFSDASTVLDYHWRNRITEPEKIDNQGTVTVLSADNVRFSGTNVGGATWDRFGFFDSVRRFFLVGDFDISLDVANFTKTTGSPTQLEFRFSARALNGTDADMVRCITVIRDTGSRNWRRDAIRNGGGVVNVWESAGGVPTGGYKLRIVRTGTIVECFYDDGGGWVSMNGSFDEATGLGDQPAYIEIELAGYQTGSNGSIDISNFTILSGTWDNHASWYREASGDHRGLLATAPAEELSIATESGLELMDRANTKMWLRFLQGSNYMFGTAPLRRVKWLKRGCLITAQGSVGGTSGSFKIVDFMTDGRTTFNVSGSSGFKGFIEARNEARGDWSGGTDVLLPSSSVLWCDGYGPDVYLPGNEFFFAVATSAGMAMVKAIGWQYLTNPSEYSLSSETDEMHWCALDPSDGELFYMSKTTMYSRNKSGLGVGYEDWMTGGIWTAEYSKALPGFRQFDFQRHAVRLGTFLYLPSDDGVWAVDWPSGSWTLLYGKALSGATHEILPEYKMITSLAAANDGAEDILVVAMEQDQRGQVVAIKLSDNSIYGKLEIVDLKVPSVVAS